MSNSKASRKTKTWEEIFRSSSRQSLDNTRNLIHKRKKNKKFGLEKYPRKKMKRKTEDWERKKDKD
jgi:hypothetical protein